MKFLLKPLALLGASLERLPRVSKVLDHLTGVDPEAMAGAPRAELAATRATGAIMVLASTWVAVGISAQLAPALHLSMPLHVLLGAGIFSLALAIECALINGIKANSRKAVLATRIAYSMVLVLAQVAPAAVGNFQAQIDAEQHRRALADVAAGQDLAAKARALPAVLKEAERARALEAAAAEKLEKPGTPPQTVMDAEATVQRAGAEMAAARKALETAMRGEAGLRDRAAAAANDTKSSDAQRTRLATALEAQRQRVAARQADLSKRTAALDDAQAVEGVAKADWKRQLEAAVNAAAAQRSQADELALATRKQADQDVAQTERLAKLAHGGNFAVSLGVLASMATKDLSIALVLVLIFVAACAVDLAAVMAKWALMSGVHARAAAAREVVEKARYALIEERALNDAELDRLDMQQALAARTLWVEQDGGATAASEQAIQAQARLDALKSTLAADLTGDAAQRMAAALRHIQALLDMSGKDVRMGPVVNAHLSSLVVALEAAAKP